MTTPKRYLFAIIDGGGTVPADTSVIRALVGRGHDVRVLADRVLAPDVESTGAEHIPWTRAPQRPDLDPKSVIINDWDAKTPAEAFARVRDGAMVGPADLFAAQRAGIIPDAEFKRQFKLMHSLGMLQGPSKDLKLPTLPAPPTKKTPSAGR